MTVTGMGDFYYRNQALKAPAGSPQVQGTGSSQVQGKGSPQVQGTGARVADSSAIDKKSPLFEQCRDFESIFVKMMLKEMRASVDKSDSLVSGGWAEDIFSDMLDDQYSQSLAKNAGFGLAEQLYRQLA